MKRILCMMFAMLAMAAIAFGADNMLLGTWKLSVAKSKPPAGLSPITNETVTWEAADGGVKIATKGEGRTAQNSIPSR